MQHYHVNFRAEGDSMPVHVGTYFTRSAADTALLGAVGRIVQDGSTGWVVSEAAVSHLAAIDFVGMAHRDGRSVFMSAWSCTCPETQQMGTQADVLDEIIEGLG